MWRKLYQERKRQEMEDQKDFIPNYDESFSDEDLDNLYGPDDPETGEIKYHCPDDSSDNGKTKTYSALRKRKREDDDGAKDHIVKKRKVEDDLGKIEIKNVPWVSKKPEQRQSVMEWLQSNQPVVEDTPTIKMMREEGHLGKDEKVLSTWINPNQPSEDYAWDIIIPIDEDDGKEPSTEDDDTHFIKKISLSQASDKIPPPQDENDEMEDKVGSHILTKDLNRKIVIKKK